jgi:hypothetical protein
MDPIELSPATIEAIAQRVVELLAGQAAPAPDGTANDPFDPVPLLPIKTARRSKRASGGRRRQDLAQAQYGTLRWPSG